MDALASTPTVFPALPAQPLPPREPTAERPAPRTAPPPTSPAPNLEAPPLPLTVQREQLKPPPAPLMSGEQMTALLNAMIQGVARPDQA